MENLRRWQLGAGDVYALQLAADARLTLTDYLDDQIWQLSLGDLDMPALVLQTRYGGRVEKANITPVWTIEGRRIQQTQGYAKSPVITAIAPGYVQVGGKITSELAFTADFVVLESKAIGGRYAVTNQGGQAADVRLDLMGYVGSELKKQPLAVVSLADGTNALSLGRLLTLAPVVVLEGAVADVILGGRADPKVGTTLNIPAGETVNLHWVHAGLNDMNASLERAQFWLSQDWEALFEKIDSLAAAIPQIETGDIGLDATIAFSYMHLMQSYIGPSGEMPYPSFVAKRQPGFGYSSRGDGTDYGRGWDGQIPQIAYLVGAASASIEPELAKGIIRNYLAIQGDDGAIDSGPGLGGQREGMLCPPILARLTAHIYQQTGDKLFVEEVYPALLRFFNRWFEVDFDKDMDEIPEWQDERQTGYIFWPTFAAGQPWAQGVDIRSVETPDLAAYLLSEGGSLYDLATAIGDSGAFELQGRIDGLLNRLEAMWYPSKSRYAYQDRDTGTITEAVNLLMDAPGDEEQILAYQLDVPSRVIIRVSGGSGRVPHASLKVKGINTSGDRIHEEVDMDDFAWRYGVGVYTTEQMYTTLDRIKFEGLSRVFRVSASTVDYTRLDINAVMPLLAEALPAGRAEPLLGLLQSEEQFLRSSGLTIVSADDPSYDADSANGGGGTWAYWTSLVGEALVARGEMELATTLVKRLLQVQAAVLKKEKRFREFYHSDEAIGLGDVGYLSGIAPLYLLTRVLGVQVVNPRAVWTGGAFTWGQPIQVRQHGVSVMRSTTGTEVNFPSGHTAKLPPEVEWQLVQDPTVGERSVMPSSIEKLIPPETLSTPITNRVIIEVEQDNSDEEA